MAETARLSERDFRFLGEMGRYDAFLRLYHSVDPEETALLESMVASDDPLVPLIMLQYLEEMPEKKAVLPILRLVESDNEVLSRAAMNAYRKNHYPGKALLLKPLILSTHARACRFAVRTLSRAGFMDALALILRELPEREGEIREEMIDALRFIPDTRSIPALLPMADSADEPTRYLALQVLAEFQLRERSLAPTFFLKHAQDGSERVRRVALEALQRVPTRGIARMFLEQGLKDSESEASRERAIRALAAFPSVEWVKPLAGLLAGDAPSSVKLASEITLKGLPDKLRRKGLLALLTAEDPEARKAAAILLAELHGSEPAVHKRLLRLWEESDEASALELVDMLRELGGPEPAGLLMDSMRKSPLMAYAAAGALIRVLGPGSGARVLELLLDPAMPQLAKQALLGHWAKRGPDPAVSQEVLPWLLGALGNEVINIRYLSVLTLSWYPLEAKLPAFLDFLGRETSPDVVRAVYKQVLKGLGRDPMPLLRQWAQHPARERLLGHIVKILTSQSWDADRVFDLLHALATPPISLLPDHAEAFFMVCVHLMERGGVTLEKVWLFLDDGALRGRFLQLLVSFMRNRNRRFPPLPLDFLGFHMIAADPRTRELYYVLLEGDGRAQSAEVLTAALLREADPDCLREGAAALRRMMTETAR